MPELHKLTPALGVLQDRGFKVALVTDGRMSGASGKVPAAIHMTPEALDGGPISKIRDGDMLRLDAEAGTLTFLGDEREFFCAAPPRPKTCAASTSAWAASCSPASARWSARPIAARASSAERTALPASTSLTPTPPSFPREGEPVGLPQRW